MIDANATDGDGAILGIPDPRADADPLTPCTPSYRIFARALGPGGNATITTCADETEDGFDGVDDVWCGSNGITLEAKKGSQGGRGHREPAAHDDHGGRNREPRPRRPSWHPHQEADDSSLRSE